MSLPERVLGERELPELCRLRLHGPVPGGARPPDRPRRPEHRRLPARCRPPGASYPWPQQDRAGVAHARSPPFPRRTYLPPSGILRGLCWTISQVLRAPRGIPCVNETEDVLPSQLSFRKKIGNLP